MFVLAALETLVLQQEGSFSPSGNTFLFLGKLLRKTKARVMLEDEILFSEMNNEIMNESC